MYPDVRPRSLMFKQVTLSELNEVAVKLVEALGHGGVCTLEGEMGAGKTTLVKALGKALQVIDPMSSPTFSIVNEYRTARNEPVFHFDFYRIKSEAEAYHIGTEEYFYSGQYCFVEWPEKIPSLLPEEYAQVKILVEDDTHRTIELLFHGRKEKKRF
jgi:tRNA threonylcarbamoyladenosine biosynthesis protein TsaE